MTTDNPLIHRTPPLRLAYANSIAEVFNGSRKVVGLALKDAYKADGNPLQEYFKALDALGKASFQGQAFAKPCFQDGDKPILLPNGTSKARPEFMKGHWILTAKTKEEYGMPEVYDPDGNQLQPNTPQWSEHVFSGALAVVEVKFYAYNRDGNKGVGAGLRRLWIYPGGVRMTSGAASSAAPKVVIPPEVTAQMQADKARLEAQATEGRGFTNPEVSAQWDESDISI